MTIQIDGLTVQQKLTAILNGLNSVNVHSYENIIPMSGAMQLLTELRAEIMQATRAESLKMAELRQKEQGCEEKPDV